MPLLRRDRLDQWSGIEAGSNAAVAPSAGLAAAHPPSLLSAGTVPIWRELASGGTRAVGRRTTPRFARAKAPFAATRIGAPLPGTDPFLLAPGKAGALTASIGRRSDRVRDTMELEPPNSRGRHGHRRSCATLISFRCSRTRKVARSARRQDCCAMPPARRIARCSCMAGIRNSASGLPRRSSSARRACRQ